MVIVNIFGLAYPSCHYCERYKYVGKNNSKVFSSIQEAINQANNGDVIFVSPGIYFENIVINKSVSLRGLNPETTIIDGGGLKNVVCIVANGTEVSGFTIKNGLHGFYVSNCSYINITLNKIEDNSRGVYLADSKSNKIRKNNVTRNNMPIVLQNSHYNDIVDNILFHNYGQALSLYYSNDNVMVRNSITDNPAFGIYLEGSRTNIVKWNNIAYVCEGIHIQSSNDSLIARNTVTNTGPYAIILDSSNRNHVQENLLINNEIALRLSNAHSNIVSTNNITQNKLGLFISCAGNNTIRNNVISNNWPFGNFGLYGEKLDDFLNDIDTSNSVNGKPIYYLLNQHHTKYSSKDVGCIALVNSSNVILENLNITGNYQAITLAFSLNMTFRNLQINNNFQGIYLSHTNHSIIMGNSFRGNIYNFYIQNSNHNSIFHNNFFDGQLLDSSHSENFWDFNYPMGGNYWGGLQIQDKFMGFYQNITGSDGISDSPFYLYAENFDKFPLAAPIKIFITDFSEDHFAFISNSTILNFIFAPAGEPCIFFNAVGSVGTFGFCRVSIPKKLLWVSGSEWEVFIGNCSIFFTKVEDKYYTHLFFHYNHTLDAFRVQGTNVVPEFSFSLLPLIIAVLFCVIFVIIRLPIRRYSNDYSL
ncbi:MAG: NosD domain-containing protein [Candidatus Bathyarchaeota archaeon]|nr:NosD domain-containing protein [Candidatus Bathyarchaeota archaeon]